VLINGVSKTYSMTGWRIGWTAGPQPLIAAMQKLQDNSTSNPNSIAQKGALAGLTTAGIDEEVEKMRAAFDARRKHIVQRLNAIPGVRCFDPAGAFYAFPDVSALLARKAPGAAATRAPGRTIRTSARNSPAMTGLAAISCQKTSGCSM